MTYHFLVRGRNCQKYLKQCLMSILEQPAEVVVHLSLDDPQDDSLELAAFFHNKSKNLFININEKRLGLCGNMWYGLNLINQSADPEDVVCIVDADDYLHPRALKHVEREYKYSRTLVTHGSYIKLSKGRRTRVSKPYGSWENIRKSPWRASHLKTFKAKLIGSLNKEMFMHNGEYLEAASDLALMFPLCELAGWDRVKFIKKAIYNWRDNTPYKTKVKSQIKCEDILRNKESVERYFE